MKELETKVNQMIIEYEAYIAHLIRQRNKAVGIAVICLASLFAVIAHG